MAEIAAAGDLWKVEQGGVGVPSLASLVRGRRVHSDRRGRRGGECSLRRFAPPSEFENIKEALSIE